MNCRSTSTFPVNGEVAQRHDQEQFPTRPIWYCFPASVQERIKRNPFGAITVQKSEARKEKEADRFFYVSRRSVAGGSVVRRFPRYGHGL